MKRKISYLLIFMLMLSILSTGIVYADQQNTAQNNSNKILKLTIDEAIKLAKQNSTDLKEIDVNLMEIDNMRISASLTMDHYTYLLSLSPQEMNSMDMDITDNYEQKLLYSDGYYYQKALASIQRLKNSKNQIQVQIEADIKASYYSLLLSEKTVELNKVNLQNSLDRKKTIDFKFANNLVTKLSVSNADIAVQQSQARYDNSVNNYKLEKLNFLYTLGLELDTEFELADKDIKYIEFAEVDLNTYISNALKGRCELMDAQADYDVMKIYAGVMKAYYTNYSVQSKIAEKQLSNMAINVENLKKKIDLSIRQRYVNAIKSRQEYLNNIKLLDLSREELNIQKVLFENGMASVMDITNAQTNVLSAEIESYSLLIDYLINLEIFLNSTIL